MIEMYTELSQIKYDIYSGKLFALFLILNTLNLIIKQTFQGAAFTLLLTPMFGLIYITAFMAYGRNIKRAFRSIITMEVLFILLLGISIVRNSVAVGAILHRTAWTICFCIPLAVTAIYVEDYSVYLSQTRFANIITFVSAVFSFLRTYVVFGGFTYENYNMEICYALLLPLFYHIYAFKTKKIYGLVAFIELIIIGVYGSRGQLLCIAVFLVLMFIKDKNNNKKMMIIIGLFCTIVIGFVLSDQILTKFSRLVGKFGSRTLSMLLRGRITYGSGRMDIWIEALNKVFEKPLTGLGVAGELTYLTSSPHNLFVELLVHYGFLLGSLFIIVILIYMFRLIFQRMDGEKELLIIMASSVIPLMLSSTYLQTPGFWITMAMISSQTFYIRNGKLIVKKKQY